jgi:enamine deaminase RidA (YjgF/YER057c/UK114 family)
VGFGSLLFYSGIVGLDQNGRLVGGASDLPAAARRLVSRLEDMESRPGFAAQTWASFERLAEAAKSAKSDLTKLLKLTVYLRDPQDLSVFETVRHQFISNTDLPAFECVAIQAPGPVAGAEIQIEAIGGA